MPGLTGGRAVAGFRVLFVEDDEITRRLVHLLLKECFLEVTLAADGREGLDLYMACRESSPFDLVISDISMPRLDGLELFGLIKDLDPGQITVIITAHEDKENLIRAIELGVDFFLSKPVLKKRLFAVMDKIISQLQHEQKMKAAEARIAAYVLELEQKSRELERLYRQLDEEMDKARYIHERNLSVKLPEVKGFRAAAYYRPAKKLGGDFYNVIRRNNKLIFYISDVSGHGLDGALLSIYVKNTINAYLYLLEDEDVEPKQVLQFLYEQYQREDYPDDYFVSLYLAAIDLYTMELSYVSAGMQIPVLLRLSGGRKLTLFSEGLPVSSALPLEIVSIQQNRVMLTPGSSILLSTDGLFDQKFDGKQYSDYLQKVFFNNSHLPPESIIQAINADFQQFNGNSLEGDDDITFLVIKVG